MDDADFEDNKSSEFEYYQDEEELYDPIWLSQPRGFADFRVIREDELVEAARQESPTRRAQLETFGSPGLGVSFRGRRGRDCG